VNEDNLLADGLEEEDVMRIVLVTGSGRETRQQFGDAGGT